VIYSCSHIVLLSVYMVDLSSLEPIERYKEVVKAKREFCKKFAESKNRCPACMLKLSICICERLDDLRVEPEKLPVDVVVYMNHKEWLRASNTAKIISRILNARVFVCGDDDDERDFNELVANRRNNAVVLFPSDSAVTWDEVVRVRDAQEGRPLVIVLDGTWGQARRLNQKIDESIPRIKITPSALSQFLCRRQTQADRVCTVEAVALLMTEMELNDAASRLEEGLRMVVEGFNLQCYNSTHRPENLLKKGPKSSSNLPRHPNSLIS